MGAEEIQPEVPVKGLDLHVCPNPTSSTSNIVFSLARGGNVLCSIYDATGCLVRTVLSSEQPAGCHSVQWDGFDNNGRCAQPGVYFVRVVTSEQTVQSKLILLK